MGLESKTTTILFKMRFLESSSLYTKMHLDLLLYLFLLDSLSCLKFYLRGKKLLPCVCPWQ